MLPERVAHLYRIPIACRSKAVELHAFGMGVHWREMHSFVESVVENGELMQDRAVCGDIFQSQMHNIRPWRQKKYGPIP